MAAQGERGQDVLERRLLADDDLADLRRDRVVQFLHVLASSVSAASRNSASLAVRASAPASASTYSVRAGGSARSSSSGGPKRRPTLHSATSPASSRPSSAQRTST